MTYQIITDTSPARVQRLVNEFLAKGYTLHGTLTVNAFYNPYTFREVFHYTQCVVKYDKPLNPDFSVSAKP